MATESSRQAFPQHMAKGLTKREYFIAAAMQGLCANGIPGSHHQPANIAGAAIQVADETMKQMECGS